MDKDRFKRSCLEKLGDSAEYYLPMVESYVFSTFKAFELEQELADESVTIKIAPRLKGKPDSEHSNPKVRMWALYREQANKLGASLGLLPTSKGAEIKKPGKKGFNTDGKMKVAS